MNKVRGHRRDHEVDLHYTRSPATGPRGARNRANLAAELLLDDEVGG